MSARTQVTAESILQDAYQNRDKPLEKPDQTIQDLDELRSFQLSKRKEYEQQLNKNRLNFGQWVRYAKWEVSFNHDFQRARSIYERALQVNVEHIPFWTHYIQLELTNKNVNHARNLLERAVTTLPRIDKFWFLYVQTEESLANYTMVRVIFERWISWQPPKSAWDAYIGFEKRYEEFQNVRQLYSRYVERFQYSGDVWLKWIQFETTANEGYVRSVYETAVDTMIPAWKERLRGASSTQANAGSDEDEWFAKIIDKWTRWEVAVGENERARAIYKALLNIISANSDAGSSSGGKLVYQLFTEFEKTYGTKESIQDSVFAKRLIVYREDVEKDPHDYDSWWAYIKLAEGAGYSNSEVSELFEKACAQIPQDSYKSIAWRRYIFLWIYYALHVEMKQEDIEGARNVWQRALKVVPHKKRGFTFGKLWILFADFETRHSGSADIGPVRKVLGRSIGVCSSIGIPPKRKVVKHYIGLEKKLGEWERCRKIYEKWLEQVSSEPSIFQEVLLEYISFEKELEEDARVVGLFEIGIQFSGSGAESGVSVDALWKEYIEYYKSDFQYEKARSVYRRFIEHKSTNGGESVQAWISFAMFESKIPTEEQLEIYEASGEDELELSITDVQKNKTRAILREASAKLKSHPEQRSIVLEAWKNYELSQGTPETVEEVTKKLPTVVTRRRKVRRARADSDGGEEEDDEGEEEEYVDYVFPEDEQKKPGLNKFLENARKWMQKQQS